MHNVFEIVKKERLYILLLVFILLVNALLFVSSGERKRAGGNGEPKSAAAQDLFLKQEQVEKILRENKTLAVLFSIASLLIFVTFLLGLVVDAILVSLKLSGKGFDITTRPPRAIRWGLLDVAKVIILFLFFGYILAIMESALIDVFPILRIDNFRMILNSSLLDVLTVAFIIYFVVFCRGDNPASLGLAVKNFFKNVFYGIVGYIALVPVLIGTLALIVFVIHLTKYVPEPQPVVELFLKEKNAAFLAYTGVFASIFGPFAEELFFRGFMYGAFKKYIGVIGSCLLTSFLFSALHTNIVGFLPIMALGILLAYIYEKTGSLVPPITVHVIHNLSMVFLVFLMKRVNA